MTVFIRVLDATVAEKPEALLEAIETLDKHPNVYARDLGAFGAIPGTPFAYWASPTMLSVFSRHQSVGESGRTGKQGVPTANDFRFIRAGWEAKRVGGWFAFAKGGSYSLYYADVHLLLQWANDGAEARAAYEFRTAGNSWGGFGHGADYYYREGLTWPRRTSGLSFRVLPKRCIFGDKGPGIFQQHDHPPDLLATLAIVNSSVFRSLVGLQLARTELAQSYEVGLIQQTPIPRLSSDDTTSLARLARRAWSLKRSLDTGNETSHAFLLPPGLNEKVTSLDCPNVKRELEAIQKQIDDAAFTLYGISAEDRLVIEAASKRVATSEPEDAEEDAEEPEDDAPAGSDAINSWLIGVAFGRFDPRLATSERAIPAEPEPFDPLPSRSPGMVPEGEEPADRPDILVDDEGHADDLTARAQGVAERVHVSVPEGLRGWLAKEFFPLHIRMYSKSRRKAPIYWQLATPSASYSVWLYLHAFSKDSLFRVQNDYVAPKLAHEERRLESMTSELRDKATAAQRKELAAQESFVDELRAFLDEVKRIAPLWNPNLDDGVVINFAPLWRLAPQHKPWQRELKTTWDSLCDGEYDWAHLAMHLWPERVVPKCAKDRSLAIAHGLEDEFWVEGKDGKWTARKTPTTAMEELLAERTSAAVKAALKSLMEAPVAQGKPRERKRR